jgi:hypothetical protein
MSDVLIVDEIGTYKPEDGFHVLPSQLCWLNKIEKKSFDMAVIRNTPSSYLTKTALYNILKLLKQDCICEVYISQKISVLQDLDAQEIESNAKLAKFSTVESSIYEKFENENGRDVKQSTIRLTLIK